MSSKRSKAGDDLRKRHDCYEDDEEEEKGTAEERGSCSFGRQLYDSIDGAGVSRSDAAAQQDPNAVVNGGE